MLDGLSAVALALSGGTLALNLTVIRTPRGALPSPTPKVSVLVPARNEALNISACVRSLLAQDYPDFELIVLNDRSEDATEAILSDQTGRHSEMQPSFRIINGKPLPTGWVGKNWACHQLAESADSASRYLLFTDADTVHHPNALRATVAEAAREGIALLSLLPEQQVETWAEKILVPLFTAQMLAYLPLPLMEKTSLPVFAAANGQFMLFEHGWYRKSGGHAAIASEIAEDVLLARLIKAHGRVRLANGAGLVRCRMYRSLAEVMNGMRRSYSSGFRIDPALSWLIVLLNLFAYLLPFTRAPRSRRARRMVAIIFLLRYALAIRMGAPLTTVAAHPVAMAFLLYSQLRAALDARRGRSVAWKGRTYPLRD